MEASISRPSRQLIFDENVARKYLLLSKIIQAWKRFIQYRSRERRNYILSESQYRSSLKNRSFRLWIQFYEYKLIQKEIYKQAEAVGKIFTKRRFFFHWQDLPNVQRQERAMERNAYSFYRQKTKITFFKAWKRGVRNQKERHELLVAIDQWRNKKFKRWGIHQFLEYRTQSQIDAKQNHACDQFIRRRVLRRIQHFIHLQFMKRLALSRADRQYRKIKLCQGISIWKSNVERKWDHLEELHQARLHSQLVLKRHSFQQIQSRVDESKAFAHQIVIASKIHQKTLVRRTLSGWKTHHVGISILCHWRHWTCIQKEKHRKERSADLFFSDHHLVQYFQHWHTLVERKRRCDQQLVRLKCQKATEKWRTFLSLKQKQLCKNLVAKQFHDEHILRHMMSEWKSKVKEKSNLNVALQYHLQYQKEKVFQVWEQLTALKLRQEQQRRQSIRLYYLSSLKRGWTLLLKNIKMNQELEFLAGEVKQKHQVQLIYLMFQHWQQYVTDRQLQQNHYEQLQIFHHHQNLKRAIFTWRYLSTRRMLWAVQWKKAESHHSSQTFRRIYPKWKNYSKSRQYRRQQQQTLVNTFQTSQWRKRSLSIFSSWAEYSKSKICQQYARARARGFYERSMLTSRFNGWIQFIGIARWKEIKKVRAQRLYHHSLYRKAFGYWVQRKHQHQLSRHQLNVSLVYWKTRQEDQVFQRWKTYLVHIKNKRERIQEAFMWRRKRLIENGLTKWLHVGLKIDRLSFQSNCLIRVKHDQRIWERVARIAQHWKRWALHGKVPAELRLRRHDPHQSRPLWSSSSSMGFSMIRTTRPAPRKLDPHAEPAFGSTNWRWKENHDPGYKVPRHLSLSLRGREKPRRPLDITTLRGDKSPHVENNQCEEGLTYEPISTIRMMDTQRPEEESMGNRFLTSSNARPEPLSQVPSSLLTQSYHRVDLSNTTSSNHSEQDGRQLFLSELVPEITETLPEKTETLTVKEEEPQDHDDDDSETQIQCIERRLKYWKGRKQVWKNHHESVQELRALMLPSSASSASGQDWLKPQLQAMERTTDAHEREKKQAKLDIQTCATRIRYLRQISHACA